MGTDPSPVILQVGALWALLLALILGQSDQEGPSPVAVPPEAVEPGEDELCPFCRGTCEPGCGCGADGHWFLP